MNIFKVADKKKFSSQELVLNSISIKNKMHRMKQV